VYPGFINRATPVPEMVLGLITPAFATSASLHATVAPEDTFGAMDTLYGHVTIRATEPGEADFLLEQSTQLLAAMYPPEACHLVSAEALTGPGTVLLGAFLGESAVGIIGLLSHSDGTKAEIKRLFVSPAHRGAGIATALMDQVESTAHEWGLTLLQLETGILQPESISLYARLGYATRGPYGTYREDDHSVFMEKKLG
jgi:putative acetyltransferase